jgi:hypothetical protein
VKPPVTKYIVRRLLPGGDSIETEHRTEAEAARVADAYRKRGELASHSIRQEREP